MLVVKIRLIDEDPAFVPARRWRRRGHLHGFGEVGAYFSKVAIRMKRWLLYVVPS